MTLEHQTALAEISGVLDHVDADSVDKACLALTKARAPSCFMAVAVKACRCAAWRCVCTILACKQTWWATWQRCHHAIT